jgi:hypothetical protein
MYTPVQSIGCYNAATNEWRFGTPEEIGEVCQALIEKDRNWKLAHCYCCCTGPGMTAIDAPAGVERALGTIQPGDTVLAGSVGEDGIDWRPKTIAFSQGTESEQEQTMVKIAFGEGGRLTLSADHVLMLADGSLTTAERIARGHSLMGHDGSALPVERVSMGGYRGAVHQIATDTRWQDSPDGHLLAANGVVVGDFTLQLHFAALAQPDASDTRARAVT